MFSTRVRIRKKTGKRLFIQPGFFEYGTNSVFLGRERIASIFRIQVGKRSMKTKCRTLFRLYAIRPAWCPMRANRSLE